jgi:hypothetical protein
MAMFLSDYNKMRIFFLENLPNIFLHSLVPSGTAVRVEINLFANQKQECLYKCFCPIKMKWEIFIRGP